MLPEWLLGAEASGIPGSNGAGGYTALDITLGTVGMEEDAVGGGTEKGKGGGVLAGCDAVEVIAGIALDDARDIEAVVANREAAVGNIAGLEIEEEFRGDGAAEELGIAGMAEDLGDGPSLDAALMVAFKVFEAGFGGDALEGIEELVAGDCILLVGIVGLGDVAEGVMLGEEAATIDDIATEDDLVGIELGDVVKEGSDGLGLALHTVKIAGADADTVTLEAAAGLVLGNTGSFGSAGTLKSLNSLDELLADGLALVTGILELLGGENGAERGY